MQKKVNKRSSMWLRTCYTLLHIILTSLQRLFVFRCIGLAASEKASVVGCLCLRM